MTIIDPCCTSKTVPALLKQMGSVGTAFWHGYADLTIAEILTPAIANYDSGLEVTIVMPRVPRYLTEPLRSLLGQGIISHLSILTDARGEYGQDVISLAKMFPNRITLASYAVADTLLLLPDTAWYGNLGRGQHIGMVTRNPTILETFRTTWGEVIERYKIS